MKSFRPSLKGPEPTRLVSGQSGYSYVILPESDSSREGQRNCIQHKIRFSAGEQLLCNFIYLGPKFRNAGFLRRHYFHA